MMSPTGRPFDTDAAYLLKPFPPLPRYMGKTVSRVLRVLHVCQVQGVAHHALSGGRCERFGKRRQESIAVAQHQDGWANMQR